MDGFSWRVIAGAGTWNTRPSGEKVVTDWSYPDPELMVLRYRLEHALEPPSVVSRGRSERFKSA